MQLISPTSSVHSRPRQGYIFSPSSPVFLSAGTFLHPLLPYLPSGPSFSRVIRSSGLHRLTCDSFTSSIHIVDHVLFFLPVSISQLL